MSFAEDFSGNFVRLIWTNTELLDKLEEGAELTRQKIRSVLEYKAPQLEAHMKINAPWTDRTGNARQGLRAEAFEDGDNMGIILYHQVPYGIWLELANGQRYAIIIPTLESQGPEVMASIERILEQI